MIIFGARPRTKTIGTGTFFCPHCQTTRDYERKEARPYFTLYFIPLFPIGKPTEFIECTVCQVAYQPEVEKVKRAPTTASLVTHVNNLKANLEDGMSVEYALRDLTGAGIDRDVAVGMIKSAIGDERRTCPTCSLSYAKTIATCREDGTALV
jgi:rubredoxin